ncbi:MAG TPA: hypothetical protein VNY33_02310 [Gaiellaceae bacterium]|nr:hypothetical protein [Gaiellaceae bacterium]
MKLTTLVLTGAACLALAAAGPAAAAPNDATPPGQALYPETVPGAGLGGVAGTQFVLRHLVRGSGSIGAARFRIDSGRANTVVYVDPSRNLQFRSLHIGAVRFVDNTAKLQGIGLLNQRRVGFTVFAVHNAQPGVDLFRIAWLHAASLGGRVFGGSVFIR